MTSLIRLVLQQNKKRLCNNDHQLSTQQTYQLSISRCQHSDTNQPATKLWQSVPTSITVSTNKYQQTASRWQLVSKGGGWQVVAMRQPSDAINLGPPPPAGVCHWSSSLQSPLQCGPGASPHLHHDLLLLHRGDGLLQPSLHTLQEVQIQGLQGCQQCVIATRNPAT